MNTQIILSILAAVAAVAFALSAGLAKRLFNDIRDFITITRAALTDGKLSPEELADILKHSDQIKLDLKELINVLIKVISTKYPSYPASLNPKLSRRNRR